MKRKLLILFILSIPFCSYAQPSWMKKATKSVVALKTFSADGALIGEATGFFVGEKGEVVSSFAPFVGAKRAVVIDAQGKEMEVECLLGANETYDVAKFRVDAKKSQPLTIARRMADADSKVWLLPYREVKNTPQGVITKTETFNGEYAYYTINMKPNGKRDGTPLLSEAGEVIALVQPSAKGDDNVYAVSAMFADSLHTTGLSINDPALRSTLIKKALPEDVGQALLTLFVASSTLDSASYVALVDDFIGQFPEEQDGYIYRAQIAADGSRYADADKDMGEAMRVAKRPDEVHMTCSRLIYQKNIYHPLPEYEPWTMERSLTEAQEAYRLNPQPGYLQQQAYVLFALKRYDEAYALYEQLFKSTLRSSEIFYEASRCKEMLNDTTSQIALLDSAVAQYSKPYLKEAAPYLLARAQALQAADKYRQAVSDLNEYESLMKTQVNDQFYYLRHRAEVGVKLYQMALNDIDRAIEMSPANSLYYAEKASLQVRVGLYDDAIATAGKCIEVAPQMSDGYLFLGLAQCLKGQKEEGAKNLLKAKELGDEQAEGLIEKYAK